VIVVLSVCEYNYGFDMCGGSVTQANLVDLVDEVKLAKQPPTNILSLSFPPAAVNNLLDNSSDNSVTIFCTTLFPFRVPFLSDFGIWPISLLILDLHCPEAHMQLVQRHSALLISQPQDEPCYSQTDSFFILGKQAWQGGQEVYRDKGALSLEIRL